MRLTTIYNLCDAFAPFALSKEYCERYGAYDNSGVIVDCGEEITGVLFSLDCSLASVEKAKSLGANLLITHHPAIYSPVKAFCEKDSSLQAIKAGISVLSVHLNLDCAEGGIDQTLCEALGGVSPTVMQPLSKGGYGRAYAVDTDLNGLTTTIKQTFRTERVTVYGENGKLSRIASFCGAGFDEGTLAFALAEGAQAIVTSDAKHHLIARAVELGLKVILPTHYAVEDYGYQKFYEKIKRELTVPCAYFTDERLL